MTTPPLLVHIGYHKTATTWLQAQFFRDYHGFKKIMDHEEVFKIITGPHGLVFDPELVRQKIKDRISTLPSGVVPVISSELLSGNPFFGGRESDVFAERLRTIWPEARVLITIRSQLKILPSVYMQYLQRGGTLHYSRFFIEEKELGYVWFSPIHYEYDRLLAKYQGLYGREKIYTMQQEILADNPERACADLANFAQAERYRGLTEGSTKTRGASYPEYSVWALRRVNHFRKSALNRQPIVRFGGSPDGLYRATGYIFNRPSMKKFFSTRRPVSQWVKANFSARFNESNARLATICPQRINLET